VRTPTASKHFLVSAILFVSTVLASSTAAHADPIVIDFEGLPDSTLVTNQYDGILFSNATILTEGISLNEFEFPPGSGFNVISDDAGPMTLSFAVPITTFAGYFTYSVPITITAFDASNNLLGSVTSLFSNNLALTGEEGSGPNEFLSLGFANGISLITITGDVSGASFTLDDLTVDGTVTVVPEPATFFLLFAGSSIVIGFRKKWVKH
jgi:hypothetical protein